MFAGELRKQKAFFAAVDGIALLAAFSVALAIHDPAHAQEIRLLGTDSRLLFLGVAAVVAVWILVFRACDLYRMRAGGMKRPPGWFEAAPTPRCCRLISRDFLVHFDGSRLTIGSRTSSAAQYCWDAHWRGILCAGSTQIRALPFRWLSLGSTISAATCLIRSPAR